MEQDSIIFKLKMANPIDPHQHGLFRTPSRKLLMWLNQIRPDILYSVKELGRNLQ